jgi:glycerate kinase
MNILVAPNSFRGSLNAFEVADIIGKAFADVSSGFEIVKIPIADGGDFTGEVLLRNIGGRWETVEVLNPLGEAIQSRFGITDDGVGIVELSEASGTRLIKSSELNPMITTTYGTGQLIKAALDAGCKKIIIGLGGSATVDGGVGLLQALGVKFLDKLGNEIPFGGEALQQIETIDDSELDSRITETEFIIPCDVHNYLLGKKGAAHVFAPQKGANRAMVETLDEALTHYSLKVWEVFHRDMVNLKYGGAAGGSAAGLWAFLNARLVMGSRFVLDELNFDRAAEKADLIITAEGRLDDQTIGGKAPFEAAMRANRFKKPIIAIAGQVPSSNVEFYHAVFSIINKPMSLETAFERSDKLLYATAYQIAKFYNRLMQPKPKAKPINELLVINFDLLNATAENLEQLAFTFAPIKKANIPLLLYSKGSYEEMLWICGQLAIHQPLIAESGGALYIPKSYLQLELNGFSEKGDYRELVFGTTKSFIENITDKLTKVSGLPSLDSDIQTPLDLADYWDIEIDEAERIMSRKYSQLVVKSDEVPPLNEIFIALLKQQGLEILETEKTYVFGNFSIKQPIEYWLGIMKEKHPDLKTIGLGHAAIDEPILELCDEAFLLKNEAEWQPMHIDNLNLVNGSGIVGLKKFVEMVLKSKEENGFPQ